MTLVYVAIAIIGGIAAGVAGGRYLLPRLRNEKEEVEIASTKAKEVLLKAKEEAHKLTQEASQKSLKRERELDKWDYRLAERQQKLNQRSSEIEKREDEIEHKNQSVEQAKNDIKRSKERLRQEAEKIAGMTKEEAKNRLLRMTEEELKEEIAIKVRHARDEWTKKADEEAKQLLMDAMESTATDYVDQMTTSTVKIENEDIKGRIIGRDGRNIKAFEKSTGVEVIVDEAPDYITLSCFDPVRREIARITLERLIQDGRIHPGRIEEFVAKARKDIAKDIIKAGEELAFKAGFPNLPIDQLKYLGRYKYRFSYGQSLARHTLEIVKLVGRLAAELGLDVKLAKKCALFHDLGKVAPVTEEGAHTDLGVELGKKLGLEPDVLNAMKAHHGEIEASCFESALIFIGDAISGARPGARHVSAEAYYKRITELEEVAKKYEGIKEAYAIYAGRELRILVDPDKVDDATAEKMVRDITKEVESTQTYPGTVQVVLIREKRLTDVAK